MSFLSLEYALFFPIVCLLFYVSPFRYRWIILLPASYIFYMAWEPWYIFLIIFSTLVDYFVALFLHSSRHLYIKRFLLLVSLSSNLGLLFFFKYHNWFADTVNEIMGFEVVPMTQVLLPVGISFYTFQTLAYTIDVYRGKQKPEYHAGYFATYVAFFPQLVAGPIERPENLLPQLHKESRFSYSRTVNGMKLIAWGLFKKAVVADRLATLVDPVYSNPETHQVLVVLATIAFGIQIYCDFSGYSDIAIGSSEIMGIELLKNFRAPYRAFSVQDFWRRWHISLSTWFKDYLFKPILSKTEGTKTDLLIAAAIVFIVSGVWHGAAWTFVIWGIIHAIMYVTGRFTHDFRSRIIHRIFSNRFSKLRKNFSILLTFFLVQFAWIFFRADSVENAVEVIKLLPVGFNSLFHWSELKESLKIIDWDLYDVYVTVFGLCTIYLVHEIQERHGNARIWIGSKPWYIRYLVYQGLIFSFLVFGCFEREQFIYFQF